MLCCSVIAQKEETDSHTMSQLLKSVWILFCPLFLERCKKTMQGKIALTLALGVLNLISKPVRQQELLSCTFPFGRIRALSSVTTVIFCLCDPDQVVPLLAALWWFVLDLGHFQRVAALATLCIWISLIFWLFTNPTNVERESVTWDNLLMEGNVSFYFCKGRLNYVCAICFACKL